VRGDPDQLRRLADAERPWIGQFARDQLAAVIQARIPAGFPLGTFVVNVTGCLVMGIAMTLLTDRLVVHPNWRYLIPVGFIGAYTTFSTFEYETFRAITEGSVMIGFGNIIASVVAGYAALWLGVVFARVL